MCSGTQELWPARNGMFLLILPQGGLVANLFLPSDMIIHCMAVLRDFWDKSDVISAGVGTAHVNRCHHLGAASVSRSLHVTQKRIYIDNCKYC